MNDLHKEKQFFHDINIQVSSLVVSMLKSNKVAVKKDQSSDYATETDLAVEHLIVSKIRSLFPNDEVLAEEGFSDTQISHGRIWIIDPICGTNNLGRGITTYCTNIALALDKQIIASCVIDHSQNDFLWSVGGSKVYINDKLVSPPSKETGTLVDVDLGSLPKVSKPQQEKHCRAIQKIQSETDFMLASFNTSLGFAYVALGKVDGIVNVRTNPWDVCASSFLIQQTGGVVTDINGNPWELESNSFLAAKNSQLHKQLLDIYKDS